MISDERKNSLFANHPEGLIVASYRKMMMPKATIERRVAIDPHRITNSELATKLNTVGGTLEGDISLRELKFSEKWNNGTMDPRCISWKEMYMSLARNEKTALSMVIGHLIWYTDIKTLGELRWATNDKLYPGRGGRKASLQDLIFTQAAFRLTPKPIITKRTF